MTEQPYWWEAAEHHEAAWHGRFLPGDERPTRAEAEDDENPTDDDPDEAA
jgi:hypothetical protein